MHVHDTSIYKDQLLNNVQLLLYTMLFFSWKFHLLSLGLIGAVILFLFSMTEIADLNDKWAAYAGPGGWNGRNIPL